MPITSFPPAPSRANPPTFADLADAYLGHLESPFVAEANALESNVNAKEASANLAATNALASANAASATANVVAWVSGTTYAVGANVWDTTNFLTYRRITAGAGTTRPGLDGTNWVLLGGQGDVVLNSNQTFTGVNTFTQPIVGSGVNLTDLNASNLSSGTVPSARLPAASETVAGVIELATNQEALNGSSSPVAMNPSLTRDLIDARATLANASANVGTLGTYALLRRVSGSGALAAGSTVLGSTMAYTSANSGSSGSSGTPPGEWRVMGYFETAGTTAGAITLCLRIS